MITANDLTPNTALPDPIELKVTSVNWDAGASRRAVVHLVDREGTPLRLIDYEGANLSVQWTQSHWYRIFRCGVNKGGQGYNVDLAPSKKTRVNSLGPERETTQILVIGDSHIGRRNHPGTGEKIDAIGAFGTAVEYGVQQNVACVVHVGDIFHESATSLQVSMAKNQVFQPLEDAGIPFFYIDGNHTSEAADELLRDSTNGAITKLNPGGTHLTDEVRLFGLDHYTTGNIPKQDLAFPSLVREPVSILFLHQTLSQLSGTSIHSVDLDTILNQFNDSFDLILSGHHHDGSISRYRDRPIIYTGASERMSTNTNATDRVAWLLSIDGESVSVERYNIPG